MVVSLRQSVGDFPWKSGTITDHRFGVRVGGGGCRIITRRLDVEDYNARIEQAAWQGE